MRRKLSTIWHILMSDKFLCFTYQSGGYDADVMTADKIYIDHQNTSKHFYNSIDESYQLMKENVKEIF